MEEFKNLKEIIELCSEELIFKDENVNATLDGEDLRELRNLINKCKEQEKIIELYEEKLMFALSPTTHELAQDTKLNFKKIIRENINEDTYTIKKVLKVYWNKKAKGE